MSRYIYMSIIMYHVVMTGNAPPTVPPEDAVERAMVTIRRWQSRRVLAEAARQQGVSSSGIAVAEVLDVIDGNAAAGLDSTVTDVARQLRLDQPRASRLVRIAIDSGLLRRSADQRDGRRSMLGLTTAGTAVLDRTRAYRRGRFALAMAYWRSDERAMFADLLTRFVAALDQPAAGPRA